VSLLDAWAPMLRVESAAPSLVDRPILLQLQQVHLAAVADLVTAGKEMAKLMQSIRGQMRTL
jgi:hypothetical protein